MQLEIEQKFPLDNPAATRERLAAMGLEFAPPLKQVDTYFAHPARDFAQTDEAFRLRQVGEENALTYKGPKLDATTKTRRELELPLPAGVTTAVQFAELFGLLGFRPVGVVEKQRAVAHLARGGYQLEVCWDEISGLGAFLELEIVADSNEVDAARAVLAEFAAELGLTKSERRSYLELLLKL
jgi:adenylate cyclase class 2